MCVTVGANGQRLASAVCVTVLGANPNGQRASPQPPNERAQKGQTEFDTRDQRPELDLERADARGAAALSSRKKRQIANRYRHVCAATGCMCRLPRE